MNWLQFIRVHVAPCDQERAIRNYLRDGELIWQTGENRYVEVFDQKPAGVQKLLPEKVKRLMKKVRQLPQIVPNPPSSLSSVHEHRNQTD